MHRGRKGPPRRPRRKGLPIVTPRPAAACVGHPQIREEQRGRYGGKGWKHGRHALLGVGQGGHIDALGWPCFFLLFVAGTLDITLPRQRARHS